MAKQIQAWETKDSQLFRTHYEAEQHEIGLDIAETIQDYIESGWTAKEIAESLMSKFFVKRRGD